MADLPPPKTGFVRLLVRLPPGEHTPGAIATATGIDLDHLGPVQVHEDGSVATVDVAVTHAKGVRYTLEKFGPVRIIDVTWQWLKIMIGRNHGLTIGHLKKILQAADAAPLGKIHIQNTHSLIGVQDHKMAAVVAKLAGTKVNGYAVRPEGPVFAPGSAAFVPQH
jgi:hypothetical protein